MNAALREAEFGNFERARRESAAALALTSTRDVQVLAALTFARSGDFSSAQRMADNLAKGFPVNTVINAYWVPTIRAAIEISHGHDAKAIDILKAVGPYELGYPNPQVEVRRLLASVFRNAQVRLRIHSQTHGNYFPIASGKPR